MFISKVTMLTGNEVETIYVPQVIKACKQKPESKLEEFKQWINEIK
ncbi:acid-resistance protein [Serratia fonticola]|uniref:Acid-resistance protein n=1 Tax=Serratia fonticola TaxID=47917 RepID=A0A4U9TM06_SERFO|nr:acid-resistance protein [Serratia fonticola]